MESNPNVDDVQVPISSYDGQGHQRNRSQIQESPLEHVAEIVDEQTPGSRASKRAKVDMIK